MDAFDNSFNPDDGLQGRFAEPHLATELAHDVAQEIVAVGELADDSVVLLAIVVQQSESCELHLQQGEDPL